MLPDARCYTGPVMSTSSNTNAIDAPLAGAQLAERWQAMAADQTFADLAGKVELTEWGEILVTCQ